MALHAGFRMAATLADGSAGPLTFSRLTPQDMESPEASMSYTNQGGSFFTTRMFPMSPVLDCSMLL